jgi:hypothetical protein
MSTSWRRGLPARRNRFLIRVGTRLHHEPGQPEPLDAIIGALI